MNYINEINGFRRHISLHPLAANAQAMWYILMHINNTCGWKEWFSVSNSRLASELQISEKTVRNIRGILVERGLIFYESQQRKKNSGMYKMISFSSILLCNHDETAVTITAELENEAETAVTITAESENNDKTAVNISPELKTAVKTAVNVSPDLQTAVTITAESGENQKTAVTVTDINKHSSYIYSSTTTEINFSDVVNFFNTNIREITPYEENEFKNWSNEFSYDLIIEAIKISVEQDKRNIKYINGILRNWSEKNLKTLDDVEKHTKNFASERKLKIVSKQNHTQKQSNKFHNFSQRDQLTKDELEKKLGIKK